MDLQSRAGWIEIIVGSMYAGKTEELLRRIKRINYAKKECIVFKPKIDNRYSNNEIVSHNKSKVESIIIEKANDIYNYLQNSLPYAIAVDEVQFLDNGIIEVSEDLADRGVRVILAGLDLDFRGESFGVVPELLARAEYVTKLKAICQVCGAPATRTQRLINGKPASYYDPIILIGAKEHYEARCRHCHVVGDKPSGK